MKLLALIRPPEGADVRDAVTARAREELCTGAIQMLFA